MPCVLYKGNKRHGKTQMAVIEGVEEAQKFKAPLWANTPLNLDLMKRLGIDYHYWENPSVLTRLENCIVIFDELPTSLDSRNWKSEEQMKWTHWFAQTEKLGVHFIYTAQREHTVEKRIRDQTDEVYDVFKIAGEPYIYYEMHDTSRSWPGPIMKRAKIYQPPFYHLYDTYARVKSYLGK